MGKGSFVNCETVFDFAYIYRETGIFVDVDDVQDSDRCEDRESADETQ